MAALVVATVVALVVAMLGGGRRWRREYRAGRECRGEQHESGAARLLLIKSVDVDTAPGSPSLVDPCFASHAAGLDVFIAGPAALDGAPEILARGGVAGSRVFLASSSRKIAS